jgi:hypothetical protein
MGAQVWALARRRCPGGSPSMLTPGVIGLAASIGQQARGD